MRTFRTLTVTALLAAVMSGTTAVAAEVNLYSYRQPFLIQPVLDRFTAETGIDVNVVYAESGILERLKAEGANSPADMVLTSDVGRLDDLVQADLVQPVQSPVLEANIPSEYRHPDGLWFGLTKRARIVVVAKDRVAPGEITSYADLADPRFNGRICTRSGKHEYMVSLIASIIAHQGADAARAWLDGVRANLARKPQGNDRAQVKAIYEGVCDVAVINSYYMGKMATNEDEPEQQAWAEAVRVVFPDQPGADRRSTGTHVNVSGAAVTKSADNVRNAVLLLEFLSGDSAQELYAEQNFEYPVKPGVTLHPIVRSWGDFTADDINLAEVAQHRGEAARLVDTVGYDHDAGS